MNTKSNKTSRSGIRTAAIAFLLLVSLSGVARAQIIQPPAVTNTVTLTPQQQQVALAAQGVQTAARMATLPPLTQNLAAASASLQTATNALAARLPQTAYQALLAASDTLGRILDSNYETLDIWLLVEEALESVSLAEQPSTMAQELPELDPQLPLQQVCLASSIGDDEDCECSRISVGFSRGFKIDDKGRADNGANYTPDVLVIDQVRDDKGGVIGGLREFIVRIPYIAEIDCTAGDATRNCSGSVTFSTNAKTTDAAFAGGTFKVQTQTKPPKADDEGDRSLDNGLLNMMARCGDFAREKRYLLYVVRVPNDHTAGKIEIDVQRKCNGDPSAAVGIQISVARKGKLTGNWNPGSSQGPFNTDPKIWWDPPLTGK